MLAHLVRKLGGQRFRGRAVLSLALAGIAGGIALGAMARPAPMRHAALAESRLGESTAAGPKTPEESDYPSRLSCVRDYQGPPTPIAYLPPHERAFELSGLERIRGVTIGPIESYLQEGRGYASARFADTLDEAQRLGANWISLTPFARVWDKTSCGIDLSFEQPHERTRQAVADAVAMAHRRGLRVMIVPHLWLESGEWRAELVPQSVGQGKTVGQGQNAAGGSRRAPEECFVSNYSAFVLSWAEVAEQSGVDMLAAGVELRSWVTTDRASSFIELIARIRSNYSGLVTYAANWDDADDTVIWGELDAVGINAFYPLHWEKNASFEQLLAGSERVVEQISALAQRFERPIFFSEFGYTARSDTAIEPWLWPEELGQVKMDQLAQARAYAVLLGSLRRVDGFAGSFVWRLYADIADMSQEPDWGFSPWGKLAEGELRRHFQRVEADELSDAPSLLGH